MQAKVAEPTRQRIRELYRSGVSVTRIASQTSVPRDTVVYVLFHSVYALETS